MLCGWNEEDECERPPCFIIFCNAEVPETAIGVEPKYVWPVENTGWHLFKVVFGSQVDFDRCRVTDDLIRAQN